MVLSRIEDAISRLEAVARQSRRDAVPPELKEIEASNARLREAVGQSLHQIDALIARYAAEPQP